jgi:hypothetical protein
LCNPTGTFTTGVIVTTTGSTGSTGTTGTPTTTGKYRLQKGD